MDSTVLSALSLALGLGLLMSEVRAAYMESDGTVSVIRRQPGQNDDDSAAPAPKGPVK